MFMCVLLLLLRLLLLSLVLRVGKMRREGGRERAEEDNSVGKHVLCVRDQNIEITHRKEEKCLAFRIVGRKKTPKTEKLMGKCSKGLHCVRFSGLCSSLVLLNLMM